VKLKRLKIPVRVALEIAVIAINAQNGNEAIRTRLL
jgi:hypothetical protein